MNANLRLASRLSRCPSGHDLQPNDLLVQILSSEISEQPLKVFLGGEKASVNLVVEVGEDDEWASEGELQEVAGIVPQRDEFDLEIRVGRRGIEAESTSDLWKREGIGWARKEGKR